MRKRRSEAQAGTSTTALTAVPDAPGAPAPPSTVERLVARQPIVGTDNQLVAFELLHRATPASGAARAGEQTVTVSAFMGDVEVDVAQLVGSVQLFCEATPEILTGTTAVTLPSKRTVLLVP